MSTASNDFGTIIGKDATFKGELSYDGAAQILGKVEGTITAKGKLSVAEGARCQADIKAGEVAVQGLVEGNVEAADRIDLQSSGVLHGDIVAARMSMADGASFVGTCRIGTNANGTPKPAAQAAPKRDEKAPEVVVKDQKAAATKK
ncbi:MAG: polymer-forming cytoskeletal protein [Phycisphaerales bacterium JB038]